MFNCFKKSFKREFYLRKLKRKVVSLLYYVNMIVPKDKKTILAFVDFEIIDNKHVPYRSDNVYLLCNYIKKQRDDIDIIYVPSNQFGGKSGTVLSTKKKLYFFIKRLTSKVILYKQPPHLSEFFTKQQHLICLGYFIPFKADYLDFTKWWFFYSKILSKDFTLDSCKDYGDKVLKHYTYTNNQFNKTNLTYITASAYASEVIARSHNVPKNSFKELGSIKSDICEDRTEVNWSTLYNLKVKPRKVILYTPTFRDKYLDKNIKSLSFEERNIFGYSDEKKILEDFLVENNILIVIKLHKSFPFYRELEKLHMHDDKSYFKNCYFLDFEMEAEHNISVYDLFESSDAMIADYSSISFDYLAYDKPIIYNIPDIEEYREYRGFSHEPIEEMMPGERVQTIEQFKEALLNIVNSKDNFKEGRSQVLSKINEVPQGKALSNIYKYVDSIIKGSSNAK